MIMKLSPKALKAIIEIAKAIAYAVLGYFGGSSVM